MEEGINYTGIACYDFTWRHLNYRQEWEGVEEGMCSENGFPMSEEWKEVRLSYAARELACHSKRAYVKQLREKVC